MYKAGDEVFYYGSNKRLYGRKMTIVGDAGQGYVRVKLEDEEDEFIVRTRGLQAARQSFDESGKGCQNGQMDLFM